MRFVVLSCVAAVAVAVIHPACGNRPPPRSPGLEHRIGRTTAAPSAALRVVTYNVHGIDGRAIARALRSDARTATADLIALQEVERRAGEAESRACVAAEVLAFHCVYAPGHELAGGGDLGVALLSRVPLADAAVIELPFVHTVVRSGRRVALGATLATAGGPVRVYAVHLDNRIGPHDRVRQLAPVLDDADARELPTIIAGDLNTSPFEFVGHVLPVPTGRQTRHVEASVQSRGYALPTRDAGATSQWLGMRLDAIYVRGLTPGLASVAHRVRASDHLPLSLDVAAPGM